jgi:hypothetical protein
MASFSPWPLVREHFRSLRDDGGKLPRAVVIVNVALPLALGVVALLFGFTLRASAGVIAGVSLLGAGLFGLLVRVFEMSSELANRARADGSAARTSRLAPIVKAFAANVGYASLVSILAAAILVAGDQFSSGEEMSRLWTALALALLVHLLTTFLLVLRRTYRVLESELQTAETADG